MKCVRVGVYLDDSVENCINSVLNERDADTRNYQYWGQMIWYEMAKFEVAC